MQLTRLNCPNCDAPLEIDMDAMKAYCPYCGQKLMFDTDQIGQLFAAREKTKQEQERTKRIEIQEKYKERKEKRKIKLYVAAVIGYLVIMFLPVGVLFFSETIEDYSHVKNGEVQVSASAKDLEKEDYRNVVQRLQSDGFETIELIKEDDLILGILAKEGQVESVAINGDSEFLENEWFPADAVVRVTYHVFSED